WSMHCAAIVRRSSWRRIPKRAIPTTPRLRRWSSAPATRHGSPRRMQRAPVVVEQLLFAWPGAGAAQGGGAGGGGSLGGGFVVDVSESFATKRRALACYRSQFGSQGLGPD